MKRSFFMVAILFLYSVICFADEAPQALSAEQTPATVSAPTGSSLIVEPTATTTETTKKSDAASTKATHLEEAVVTATRTERATAEIPAGVTAVTREDIENTRMFAMKEALTGISGVQSETKNGGYDSRLIIRGAGLKARYGVREIMVLLDGVPITDPDGLSRFDFIDTQLVERIDVLKGPNSTLYGANAAGGVVNIITRNPFEETTGGRIGYGSNNTQMYNALYGNKIDDTYFSISGSRRSSDSWRQWNKFDTTQGNLKVGTMIDERTTVEATANYSEANLQLPGTLTQQ